MLVAASGAAGGASAANRFGSKIDKVLLALPSDARLAARDILAGGTFAVAELPSGEVLAQQMDGARMTGAELFRVFHEKVLKMQGLVQASEEAGSSAKSVCFLELVLLSVCIEVIRQ